MSDFGIFAKDLRVRVTNAVKTIGKVVIIPCQMGFKKQDGGYVNEWIDIVVFEGAFQSLAQSAEKGEQITVNGRMTMKEYNEKKSWQILCDTLEIAGKAAQQPVNAEEDCPF